MFELERLASLLTVSNIADIASLVSLVVSIYVALNLRAIRKNYIFRLKAPEFMKALKTCARDLNQFGNDFENSTEAISDELTKIDVRLGAMSRRMRRRSKKSVKELRGLIKAYEEDRKDQHKFRQVL